MMIVMVIVMVMVMVLLMMVIIHIKDSVISYLMLSLSFLCSYYMLAPPGGFARAGTRSSVTTCDVYPQPFVVLVVMVFIFTVFFHIKCVFFRSRLHTMFSDAIDH